MFSFEVKDKVEVGSRFFAALYGHSATCAYSCSNFAAF